MEEKKENLTQEQDIEIPIRDASEDAVPEETEKEPVTEEASKAEKAADEEKPEETESLGKAQNATRQSTDGKGLDHSLRTDKERTQRDIRRDKAQEEIHIRAFCSGNSGTACGGPDPGQVSVKRKIRALLCGHKRQRTTYGEAVHREVDQKASEKRKVLPEDGYKAVLSECTAEHLDGETRISGKGSQDAEAGGSDHIRSGLWHTAGVLHITVDSELLSAKPRPLYHVSSRKEDVRQMDG